ncbi:Beta-galactosidase C-terminal domain [Arthrobacter sp. YN]|uniref:Beta-galactosidase C-terminal domain n=1 Tax=Arthrobacter sp. YN TaxID=2020486 RepID=UPI001E3C3516|nr:Beta-galactosidase C-terminal domain [Arthrobacter sp. YN]
MVLNHNDAPSSVDVLDGGTDRLSGRAVTGLVELPANGVLILDEILDESAGRAAD